MGKAHPAVGLEIGQGNPILRTSSIKLWLSVKLLPPDLVPCTVTCSGRYLGDSLVI